MWIVFTGPRKSEAAKKNRTLAATTIATISSERFSLHAGRSDVDVDIQLGEKMKNDLILQSKTCGKDKFAVDLVAKPPKTLAR